MKYLNYRTNDSSLLSFSLFVQLSLTFSKDPAAASSDRCAFLDRLVLLAAGQQQSVVRSGAAEGDGYGGKAMTSAIQDREIWKRKNENRTVNCTNL